MIAKQEKTQSNTCVLLKFILMHLQMQRGVWLDNVMNLRQYILRYTVGNSNSNNNNTVGNSNSSLDEVRLYASCNAPIWAQTTEVH